MKFTKNLSLWLYFVVPMVLVWGIKYLLLDNKESEVTAYQPLAESSSAEKTIPDKIDYIFHVKPILSDRCYLCHGPDDGTREAGLRLDIKEEAYAALGENKDHYAIVPGDPENSAMVYRITHEDADKRMPPEESNLSLSEYEKQILVKWIEQGATWKDHWAFVAPVKPEVPRENNLVDAVNEIDLFVAEVWEQQGMKPSEPAKKEKLIRRLYFDLTGLPPSVEEVEAFVNDNEANAYEKVVDRLLTSPAYGERMAAEWLDIARYADTHGYQDDLERIMWPWRDWVIHAFNSNLPYDEFVTWQLAGDLLPDATLEQILATGFNRNHKITQEGGVIDEEYRVEYVMDRTITTSKALMGITMECARCHSHKYDPISQEDFYSMYGFFNQLNEKGRIEYDEIPQPNIFIDKDVVADKLPFVNLPDSVESVKVMVMKEEDKPMRKTYVLNRGTYDNPTTEVDFGTPEKIMSYSKDGKNNRLGLADWFFDEQHPLTSRVAVNRLWQQMFGRGIVGSTGDFGNQGDLPSHPELLDWLAVTYREEGWDTKKMLKMMAMSYTYRQTTNIRKDLLKKDPENIYLARSSRDKLTAEMIRDNALFVSGLLVDKVGGPSVKPYQPPGLWAETTSGQGLTKYIPDTGENLYRRSLYTFWKRTVPPPSMMTFDAASRDDCTVKRQKTSTPLQALVMLNDPQVIEASRNLAAEILHENLSEEERITRLFKMITSRLPDIDEVDSMADYLDENRELLAEKETEIEDIPDSFKEDPEDYLAYSALINMLFNLDESIVKG